MRKSGLLLLLGLIFCLLPLEVMGLEPMDEAEMDRVQGQSGIAMTMSDLNIYNENDYLAYEDTSAAGNRIEFADTASFYAYQSLAPTYLQVYTNQQDLVLVGLEVLAEDGQAMDMGTFFQAENYTFSNQHLGSMDIEDLSLQEFALYLTPAEALDNVQGSGMAMQMEARSSLQEFRWNYQSGDGNDQALVLGQATVAQSFDQEGQPQGRFQIGELDARDENSGEINPALFQVRQDENDQAFVRMNLPMQGSLRVEDVQMGDHDLGPIRVEGMQIHHLQMDFVPYE